eukprot:scaffold44_cov339-Pavlova_lutheri.AAC.47
MAPTPSPHRRTRGRWGGEGRAEDLPRGRGVAGGEEGGRVRWWTRRGGETGAPVRRRYPIRVPLIPRKERLSLPRASTTSSRVRRTMPKGHDWMPADPTGNQTDQVEDASEGNDGWTHIHSRVTIDASRQ